MADPHYGGLTRCWYEGVLNVLVAVLPKWQTVLTSILVDVSFSSMTCLRIFSASTHASSSVMLYNHTHTAVWRPFVWDYLGEPVPEETFTHIHLWVRRRIRTDNTAWELIPLYSALSQWGLLDPIKPAYNQSRPDGRLKLTASAFNPPWSSMM